MLFFFCKTCHTKKIIWNFHGLVEAAFNSLFYIIVYFSTIYIFLERTRVMVITIISKIVFSIPRCIDTLTNVFSAKKCFIAIFNFQ